MEELLNFISANADSFILAIATGTAGAIAMIFKLLFNRLNYLADKTETELDDKIVYKVKEILKEKMGDI